VLMALW